MIVINDFIPFRGFVAMTIWPFIFVRKDEVERMKKAGTWNEMLRHEHIHCAQQLECLFVGCVIALALILAGLCWWSLLALPLFFYWYLVEWLIRLCVGRNAYRNICFEREAYFNQMYLDYLSNRKHFAFIKYMFYDE